MRRPFVGVFSLVMVEGRLNLCLFMRRPSGVGLAVMVVEVAEAMYQGLEGPDGSEVGRGLMWEE